MVVFRRPWTGAEDLALREAVLKYGTGTGPGSSWSTVSRLVGGGRSNKVGILSLAFSPSN